MRYTSQRVVRMMARCEAHLSMSRSSPHPPTESHLAEYAALYGTITAFALVTLIVQRQLWQDVRWLIYLTGVIAFGLIADRGARGGDTPLRQAIVVLLIEGGLVVGLFIL